MAQDVTIYQESCTKSEHQALMHLRKLCDDPTAVVAVIYTMNRESLKVRVLPDLNLLMLKAIDKYMNQ
jgi:hypothetical protein